MNATGSASVDLMSEGATEKIPDSMPSNLSIGIVVPVFNEARTLDQYLCRLYEVARARCPVVVVDGGSTDASAAVARRYFHTEATLEPNRGEQLNCGARCLLTDVLLFLHADTELPRGFDYYIRHALADGAVVGGCFRLEFDSAHPVLQAYSWFTRFSGRFFHFGDQGFFIRREVFIRMGGFSPLPFLEDVDFLKRARKFGKFSTLSAPVRTSARRFLERGMVSQQLVNVALVTLFELGVSAKRLAAAYPHVR
jgi:rSAM/selenodomain-associated transferase 2